MIDLPQCETGTVTVKLKPAAESLVRQGHPWIFDQSITKQNRPGQPGDLAIVYDQKKNKFLACGLYDPASPIRIKVLQSRRPATIDRAWFRERIEAAYGKRRSLLETDTNSYRLIHGENDGLPSLVADVYASVLVVKLYSFIWLPYLEAILQELLDVSQTDTLVLRMSRNVQKEGNAFGLDDGQVLHGTLDDDVVVFREHGVLFSANVVRGHKTGYFLDHRENRRKVGGMAAGKSVLDVFSYAGGFSIHALVGGATEVTSLDISAPALETARSNAALNTFSGKHSILVGDAFDKMEEMTSQGRRFDIVVIDPPSFAKKKTEVERALNSYRRLATLGAGLVSKGGTLVLASCSSRVAAEEFFELVQGAVGGAVSSCSVIETTRHDSDHPIGFSEGAYLKCVYLGVG